MDEPALAELGRIAVDIRIGVTGHRWIPATDAGVQTKVAAAIADLAQRRGNRSTEATQTGVTLVSALAEGADRIAAAAALKAGARLEAVLPMPVEKYEKCFADSHSVADFRALLARAATVDTLVESSSPEQSYLEVGHAIVDRADVLLAIWDGHPAAGTGGTAEVVSYAEGQNLPIRRLTVSRSAGSTRIEDAGETPRTPALTEEAFSRLDRFNRARLRPREQRRVAERLRPDERGPGATDWLPYFLRADLLALRYQRAHRLVSRLLYVLAVLAVVIVAGQHVFFPHHPGLAWFEFADLALLLGMLYFARRDELLGRWTSARFIAERIRSAQFLADVGAVPSFALRPGARTDDWSKADWAGRAIREVWFRTRRHAPIADAPAAIGRIDAGWIVPQLEYHRAVLRRSELLQRRFGQTAFGLFGISLLAAVLHSLELLHPEGAPDYWAYTSIVVPAIGAAISGYAAQREFGRQAIRSRQVLRDLSAAQRALVAAPSVQAVRSIATQIDSLVHGDAADWFINANLHEPELP